MTHLRGAAKVREAVVDETREMQARVYRRVRPYLAGAMSRLRRGYPAFQTVVFNAETSAFALVFGDGTRPDEASNAFSGLKAACEELARLSDIEWITASDSLWQVRPVASKAELAVEQYRHIEDAEETWHFWMRSPLRDARYSMRRAIYSRTVYGSHRPGYGKRIVDVGGAVVDEWVDPVEPMILRSLRANVAPVGLETLCDTMNRIAGFQDGFYIWDVLHACARLVKRGTLRRINPRSSAVEARFVLLRTEVAR